MARDYLDRYDKKVITSVAGLFERGGSPEHMARGIAAGILGVFFPLRFVRFVAAFVAALFFRGNKALALGVPAVAVLFDLQFIARFEIALSQRLWHSGALEWATAVEGFNASDFLWTWLHPIASFEHQLSALAQLSAGAMVLVFAVALLSGGVVGAVTYPFSLIAFSFFYDAKYRTQQYLDWKPRTRLEAFSVPIVPDCPKDLSRDALREMYCGRKHPFMLCASAHLLIDGGQAYPEMLHAIGSARKTLVLETYILRDDKFGTLFGDALQAAARRGVKTRVICDGVGSMGLPDGFKTALVESGIELRIFHPLSSFWRGGFGFLQRRDHRKIIVVDHAVSLMGGLNIADEYAATKDGGGGWRDTHIRIDGRDAAGILTAIFEETWRKAEPFRARQHAPKNAPAQAYVLPPATGEDWVQDAEGDHAHARFVSGELPLVILSNRELLKRVRIKRAYLKAINAAQCYVLIENAFFIPDRDVLRALYKAVKRGVKVAVVVAMKHDIRIAAMAARALYDELLSNGVRLFEYPISMIHSKVAAIDDRWSIVSSYNLNHRSLVHDLEVGALFFDEPFTKALRDQILEDISKCNELTKELHRSRAWNIALSESVCYQFRYWL